MKEVKIYPEGDLTQMVCIGEEITEELEFTPAKFYIKRYIRYKYALKVAAQEKQSSEAGVIKIGALPSRVIDKGIPSASLLSIILCDKYLDHLPLYRQRQRFARDGIQIASSTLEGWAKQCLDKLEPLYDLLVSGRPSTSCLSLIEFLALSQRKEYDKARRGTAFG